MLIWWFLSNTGELVKVGQTPFDFWQEISGSVVLPLGRPAVSSVTAKSSKSSVVASFKLPRACNRASATRTTATSNRRDQIIEGNASLPGACRKRPFRSYC